MLKRVEQIPGKSESSQDNVNPENKTSGGKHIQFGTVEVKNVEKTSLNQKQQQAENS